MAIPWLIGAAVVAAAGIIAASGDDEAEEEARQRARARQREIEREAERREEEARKAEKRRSEVQRLEQERERARREEKRRMAVAEYQVRLVIEKYSLGSALDQSSLARLVINNPDHCALMLTKAFENSASIKRLQHKIETTERDVAQMQKLYLQFGG